MAVKLNRSAYDHASRLIHEGQVVLDDRDAWSEHQPSARAENEYIEAQGFAAYGRWYLGIDDEASPKTKGRHKYPYGDFEKVHRCGVISAESRAAQRRHEDIKAAAAHLHGMLEQARVA